MSPSSSQSPKSQNILITAAISLCRDFDLEVAIIRATADGSARFDFKYAHLVFSCVQASTVSLRSLILPLMSRMRKTDIWPVALKGLILLHGVLHCGFPAIVQIEKLGFDTLGFTDKYLKLNESLGFNVFIQNYFSFLDQRCCFAEEQASETEDYMAVREMQRLKKL